MYVSCHLASGTIVNYWCNMLLLYHKAELPVPSFSAPYYYLFEVEPKFRNEVERWSLSDTVKRGGISTRIAAVTDGRTIERLMSRKMEAKIEEGIETTTTRKKQTNSGLKIDITTSSNQSISPNIFKSQCVLPLTPILWISKTVKHPSSLLSVEDFTLWTPPPIHNSPWNSWFFIIPVNDGCAQCDRKSVVTTKFSPFSHPCTVSQHKEGGLYITTATTLHVCVVLFDIYDCRSIWWKWVDTERSSGEDHVYQMSR